MRVMITGAAGLVGRAATERFGVGQAISPAGQAGLPAPHRVCPLTHADLDITDSDAVQRTIADLRPDLVVNCAVLGVDACERDPAAAKAINADGPAALAGACQSIGATLVHFSSNYVFGGEGERIYTVEDEPAPVNVYGRTKLDGERVVTRRCRRAFIIRTSWVFGRGKESFLSTAPQRLRHGEAVRAIADVWASTTYVIDLVERVADIVRLDRPAVYHVVNEGICSYETFAREAARLVHADERLIERVSEADMLRVPRPRYTPMRCLVSEKLGLPPLRSWRDALAAYVKTLIESAQRGVHDRNEQLPCR